jgi:AraC-like DNA-binding protein
MENEKLYIKNMVCDRCKMAVRNELEKLHVSYHSVELGIVELNDTLSNGKKLQFKTNIESLGFELIEDKTARIVSGIKSAIIEFVRSIDIAKNIKLSVWLSDQLKRDYNYLSNLFSVIEGTTIEQYVINQKIERVKELLAYNELSLGEIAHVLSYSSIQHLSTQFKKVTGLTPSDFKKIGQQKRKPLDAI